RIVLLTPSGHSSRPAFYTFARVFDVPGGYLLKKLLSATPWILVVSAAASLHAQNLSVDKNPLNFSAQAGGAALTQTLNVLGSGSFTTFPGATWLRVNPINGTAPSAVTVTADPAGLAPGVYGGTLSIFGANRVDVQVNLTVNNIAANPDSLK